MSSLPGHAAGKPPVARAIAPEPVSRRRLVRAAFWATLGATPAATLTPLAGFLQPQRDRGWGTPVAAGRVTDYPPGADPVYNKEGRFWLVHITPERGGEGKHEGLLALYARCPHDPTTVVWWTDYPFMGITGWLRCPQCHSTFTLAGIRVFGPAPRSMDTMKLEIASGSITVYPRRLRKGGEYRESRDSNPSRSVRV